ncbi:MAG: redox-sensing transcriptional repressor Rex [Sedimentisphaerales bacterium]|nr:redox-sensing transcriptional repressor Rex [Sedimentisphaerales bacterium]
MRYRRVPDETVRRMPLYLRGVRILSEKGQGSICSKSLADCLGISAWQIRKDFSYFGDFGKPGVGYDVAMLESRINKILNLGCGHNVVLVGAGNLGSAILSFNGFRQYGFNIIAAFDRDAKKIGKKKGPVVIEDVSRIARMEKKGVDLGIIAVPVSAAQEIADALTAIGVKGILNFAPVRISVPKKVKIVSIDIAVELARLPYYMVSSQSQGVVE